MTLGKNENTLGKNENTEKAMKNLVVWKSLKIDQPLAILTKNKERKNKLPISWQNRNITTNPADFKRIVKTIVTLCLQIPQLR